MFTQDQITALGLSTDYDRIGLKPDQREINLPPITHLVAIVDERGKNTSSPKLKPNYVRISEPIKLDTLQLEFFIMSKSKIMTLFEIDEHKPLLVLLVVSAPNLA